MTMYAYFQETPTSKWECFLASERERVIAEEQPAFTTILDVDNSFTDDLSLEELQGVKYLGPMYADFDGAEEDIGVVIDQFKKFLVKLQSQRVDLDAVRLYLTGGRGAHVEIPLSMFAGKVSPTGIANLPHIYREIAHLLYVDLMDMRVYSARKGRMWRTPNVKRSNGKYKVAITPEEALNLTPEMYEELCSAPRALPPPQPASFNPALGLIYSQAKDKVDAAVKKSKSRKKSHDDAKRFKGEWPDTVKAILQGQALKESVGWNSVAMQLALCADALGKSEEQLLNDAELLIETYQGDSSRYGTPRKRREQLREQYRYLSGNPLYEFSIGGLMSLVSRDHDASDITNGEYVPDDPEEEVYGPAAEAKAEAKVEEKEDPEDEDIPTESSEDNTPVRVNKHGIFAKSDDGWKRASWLGLSKPFLLLDNDGKCLGYDVEVYVESKPKGRHIVGTQNFSTKSSLNNLGLTWSTSVNTSDSQTSQLADILRKRVEKNDAVTYVVHREGIDLVMPPHAKTEDEIEMVWCSPHGVVSPSGTRYRFSSNMDKGGAYGSDLMNAPALENTPDDAALVEALLSLNHPLNVARLLGWFCAAFLTQPIRRVSGGKFPALQIYGQAEAGKSRTVGWYNHIHYFLQEPKEMMSVGGTNYPAIVACATSASMPVIFEEMKMQEMSKARKDFLKALLRSSYDGHAMERGGLSRDAGPKEVVVNKHKLVGPVAFVGEALEDQTAILDRCITVALSKDHRRGREKYDATLERRCTELGKIGKLLAMRALAVDIPGLRDQVFSLRDKITSRMADDKDKTTRLSKALVVPLIGLEHLKGSLATVFGDQFDERIDDLVETILSNLDSMLPNNKAEASKVLDVMAQLTRTQEIQYKLEKGTDYVVSDDGLSTEINLKSCYAKYVKYVRSMGMEPLYASESVFVAGMANYGGTKAKACPASVIWKNPQQIVYRLDNEYLVKEQCEPFEP